MKSSFFSDPSPSSGRVGWGSASTSAVPVSPTLPSPKTGRESPRGHSLSVIRFGFANFGVYGDQTGHYGFDSAHGVEDCGARSCVWQATSLAGARASEL